MKHDQKRIKLEDVLRELNAANKYYQERPDGEKIGQMEKKKYVIVRTYSMGVFAGELANESTETVKILHNSRRIWYWSGAASLSQLATDGTSDPVNCKFPCEVSRVELTSPNGF